MKNCFKKRISGLIFGLFIICFAAGCGTQGNTTPTPTPGVNSDTEENIVPTPTKAPTGTNAGDILNSTPTPGSISGDITHESTPTPGSTSGDTTSDLTPTPVTTQESDTVPPVITGVKDIRVKVNGTIAYTVGVSATDDSKIAFSFRGDNANLRVDNSLVDLSTPGTYEITYYAIDNAGNEASATAHVFVSKVSPDDVDALVNKVISEIITDDMTKYEKAKAIFDYVHGSITYYEKKGEDYLESAYYGLHDRLGDCNVFAATSKVLLDAAGIDNIDIKKDPDNGSPHVWNLVNTGDGWYHFDTVVWHYETADIDARDSGIFMWTDERIQSSGSRAVRNQHVYNKDLYPEVM